MYPGVSPMLCQLSYEVKSVRVSTSKAKVAGSIPTVVRLIFQLARCGYTLRVTQTHVQNILPYMTGHNGNITICDWDSLFAFIWDLRSVRSSIKPEHTGIIYLSFMLLIEEKQKQIHLLGNQDHK